MRRPHRACSVLLFGRIWIRGHGVWSEGGERITNQSWLTVTIIIPALSILTCSPLSLLPTLLELGNSYTVIVCPFPLFSVNAYRACCLCYCYALWGEISVKITHTPIAKREGTQILFGYLLVFIWVPKFYSGTQFLFGYIPKFYSGTQFSFGYIPKFYSGTQFSFGYLNSIQVPSFYLGT